MAQKILATPVHTEMQNSLKLQIVTKNGPVQAVAQMMSDGIVASNQVLFSGQTYITKTKK